MTTDVSYDRLPEHMRPVARAYIERGELRSDFLWAVLSNDLRRSFAFADDINRVRMHDWVKWMCNDIPGQAHGSRKAVDQWRQTRRMEQR